MASELVANSPTPGQVLPLATLTAAQVSAVSLTFTMSAPAPAALRGASGNQFRVVIDAEIVLFDASQVSTTTWTALARGAEGSTATTHSIGSSVLHYLTAGALLALSSGEYSVARYGAVGDGKIIADAAITGGSATLTSLTANFTKADETKTVIVSGAGSMAISGAGSNSVSGVTSLPATSLATTIQTFVNATTVTLAAPAANTVTGAACTYGTDDTTAVQNAVSAAAAAGALTGSKVYATYKPGRVYVHGQITMTSGGCISAYGATIQANPTNWTSKGFLCNSGALTQGTVVSNVDVFGGTWVGSGQEVENHNMKWFFIGAGLGLQDSTIKDVTLTGWGACPVLITNPTRVKFLDSHLYGNEFNESGFNNSIDYVNDGVAAFGGEILVRGVNFHNSVADAIALVFLVPNTFSGPVHYTVTECVGTADPPAVRPGCQTQTLGGMNISGVSPTFTPSTPKTLLVSTDPVAAGFLACGQLTVAGVSGTSINYTGLQTSPPAFLGCTVSSGTNNKTGTTNGAITAWVVLDPNCVVGDFLKYISGPSTAKLSQIVSVVQGVGYTLAVAPASLASGLTLYVGVYRNCIQLEVDAQGPGPVTDFTFSNNDVIGYERAVYGVNAPAAHACTRGLITGNRGTNGQVNAAGQWSTSNAQGSCLVLSGSSAAHSVTVTDNDLSSASAPLVPEIAYGASITNNAPQSNNNFTGNPSQGTATLAGGTVSVPTAEIRPGDDVRLDVITPGGTRGIVQLGAIISGTLTATLIQGTLTLTVGSGNGTAGGSVTLAPGSIAVPATGTVLGLLSPVTVGGNTAIVSGATLTIDSPTTGHLSVNATNTVTAQAGTLGVLSPVTLGAGSIAVPANTTVLGVVGPGIGQGSTLTINTSTTGTLSNPAIAAVTTSPVGVGNFAINSIQAGTASTLQSSPADTSGVRWKIDH